MPSITLELNKNLLFNIVLSLVTLRQWANLARYKIERDRQSCDRYSEADLTHVLPRHGKRHRIYIGLITFLATRADYVHSSAWMFDNVVETSQVFVVVLFDHGFPSSGQLDLAEIVHVLAVATDLFVVVLGFLERDNTCRPFDAAGLLTVSD